MHIIVNTLAVLGAIGLIVVSFLIWTWLEERKEARRLRALPYKKDFLRIAEWTGDDSVLWGVEELSKQDLDFEVIFFDRAEAVVTSFDGFDPENIPLEIRPAHWYVRMWDSELGRCDVHSRLFLCSFPEWRISQSGQYWTNPDAYHVEISDRLGITMTFTTIKDEEGKLNWIDLLKKIEGVVTHSNAVWHYETRVLKGEISTNPQA